MVNQNKMKKIEAKIVTDSINQQGGRITTYLLTFPRFILAELNTHRVFSKNSASSRAIPLLKMVKMVKEDPFIPIAWQKNHPGMQGTEYLSKTDKYNLVSFIETMSITLHSMIKGSEEYDKLSKELDEKVEIIETLLTQYTTMTKTLDEWWLFARDKAVEAASIMYVFGVTKQLCNRLLEPFMWHTVLLTGTEFENFFKLRCPQYQTPVSQTVEPQYSWKDLEEVHSNPVNLEILENNRDDYTFKFQHSKSSAEIHIQALAEAMYDAYNESTPKELKEGEWHIPFGDRIDDNHLDIARYEINGKNPEYAHIERIDVREKQLNQLKLAVATARCARLSYMTFDGEIDYEKDLKLHDTLLESQHMSPFEHCARAMSEEEYSSFIKGKVGLGLDTSSGGWGGPPNTTYHPNKNTQGWCNNFRGFIQYRYLIENKK